MDTSTVLSRQGHRLLQIGVVLLLFTSFEGFAIPYLAAPLLGRSVHTLSARLVKRFDARDGAIVAQA